MFFRHTLGSIPVQNHSALTVNSTVVANAMIQAEEHTTRTEGFNVNPTTGPSSNGEDSGDREVKPGETFEATLTRLDEPGG
jgi:hypothetical protein